jgi:hypothetical protein
VSIWENEGDTALIQSQAVAGSMRAVDASMVASDYNIAKNADAQNQKNGIMVFAGKLDLNDIEVSEFYALQHKIHLQNERSEVYDLSLVASIDPPPSNGSISDADNENDDLTNNGNMSSANNN